MVFLTDEKFYNTVIETYFNFFNGRVNMFNYPAELVIDWAPNETNNGVIGVSVMPNRVFIYPRVLLHHVVNQEMFMYECLETVIHELFHIDQAYNPMLLSSHRDIAYVNTVEAAVNCATASYIINNAEMIQKQFALPKNFVDAARRCMSAKIDRFISYGINMMYYRRNIYNHLCAIIDDLVDDTKISTFLVKCMTVYNKNVCININGNTLSLYKDGTMASIHDINEFFWNNVCKYFTRNIHYELLQVPNDSTVMLKLDIHPANDMVRKII